MNALNELSPAAAQTALRQALQQAPSHRRPSDEDARLFVTAGTSTVPYTAVIDWLKIRKTVDMHAGCLPHDTVRHWLRGWPPVRSPPPLGTGPRAVGRSLTPPRGPVMACHRRWSRPWPRNRRTP
ncbi:MAG: hypothetical protein IPK66_17350 [Rhodospirillales bacterium]|nr:hypothetical protein [Rhodospirillales bacterium]